MIADDTPQAAELLEAFLAETDCETRIAYDGEQTLQQVAAWEPDVILLDVMMPRMSGFEVCKRLRADPRTQHIPVLMVTADRGLRARLPAGTAVTGPGWLLERLDAAAEGSGTT